MSEGFFQRKQETSELEVNDPEAFLRSLLTEIEHSKVFLPLMKQKIGILRARVAELQKEAERETEHVRKEMTLKWHEEYEGALDELEDRYKQLSDLDRENRKKVITLKLQRSIDTRRSTIH